MKNTIMAIACLLITLAGGKSCTNINGNGNSNGDNNGNSKENTEIDLSKVTVSPEEMVERYDYTNASGMRYYQDENGEIYTSDGEMTLKKTDKGGMLYVRYEYVKRDTISVDDEVFMHISKIAKAYNLQENQGRYTDSDMFVTDVGPWNCYIKLKNGTSFSGAVIMAFHVKDEKRMQRYEAFRQGISEINSYLRTFIKH